MLVGCMAVRNEDWILNLSARVVLMWCDQLVILLHECTDYSAKIARTVEREHPGCVAIETVTGGWAEMEHRQKMLHIARQRGASHIAIVDADEVMTANTVEKAREAARNLREGQMLQSPLFNLRHGIDQYHGEGVWSNRSASLAFHDDPRLSWSGDRFHAREPEGVRLIAVKLAEDRSGGILHFWGASEKRLIAKHALYKMTEVIRWPHKPLYQIDDMYNQAFLANGTTMRDVNPKWFAGYEHLMQAVDIDRHPWQEDECKRLMVEHGARKFAGLDLFGVVPQ